MATKTPFKTRNDMSATTRNTVVGLLNQHLADLSDLYSQVKQAHWNVKGPNFQQLHELFDMLAGIVIGHIDIVAERVTMLGGIAHGTVRMASENSRLAPYDEEIYQDLEVAAMIADRYATVAESARKAIDEADEAGDTDSADLFTALSRDLDKGLWFIEAHLQG